MISPMLLSSVFKLVESYDFSLQIPSDRVELRIEVFQQSGVSRTFKVRLFRYESFRIQSTFPQAAGAPVHPPSDELILKEFESFCPSYAVAKAAENSDYVLEATIDELLAWAATVE